MLKCTSSIRLTDLVASSYRIVTSCCSITRISKTLSQDQVSRHLMPRGITPRHPARLWLTTLVRLPNRTIVYPIDVLTTRRYLCRSKRKLFSKLRMVVSGAKSFTIIRARLSITWLTHGEDHRQTLDCRTLDGWSGQWLTRFQDYTDQVLQAVQFRRRLAYTRSRKAKSNQ